MSLLIEVKDKINRDITEVFQAIVNKDIINKYFVSSASSDLKENSQIQWEWSDACASCKVYVISVKENKKITFNWSGNEITTEVNMTFTELENSSTEILITESSYEKNDEGIKKVMQQTQGWTDFICSLKAYLYTGINLRNGKMN